MSAYEQYREDLPELIRGRLEPGRAGEILEAAKTDETLRNALEQERSLERWLDYYEVPEPSEGFQGRFWRRFSEERVIEGRRTVWLIRLVGPLAAAILIAIGVIVFVNNGDTPPQVNGGTASVDDAGVEPESVEVTWPEDEFDYVIGSTVPDTQQPRRETLSAEDLALMKQLDNAAFLPLDDLERPEDVQVIDDLELLTELSEEE
ncbi:MAG: hypothetical protein H6839_01205 [Planctomycetes bacterium]|nr:hypothetical protein [Planctomycetota bacterium]